MFDHIGIVYSDLARAGTFYRAILEPLGIRMLENHTQGDGTGWLVFGSGAPESPFFVVAAGRPSFWDSQHQAGRSPTHVAFRTSSRAAVDEFHAAGLRAGGRNNGDPGVRSRLYYCAFLIDPEGNNVEAGTYA